MTVGNLGNFINASKQISQAVYNAKAILAEDGDDVALLGTAVQLGLLHVIKTGSGFTKDDIMYPEYDSSMLRTAWRSLFWDHLHDQDGSKGGGSLIKIWRANMAKFWEKHNGAVLSEWSTSGTGTLSRDRGVIPNTHDRLKFLTLGTTNSACVGNIGGIELSFTDIIDLQMYMEVIQNTQVFSRMGINVDRIDDTQDTARRQFGLESCPASGTTFVVISANGSAGNLLQVATTVSINAQQKNHQFTYHPGVDVKYFKDGVLEATTNSANTPSNGNTDRAKLLVWGLKTNENVAKEGRLYHYYMSAKPNTGELFVAV